MAPRSPTYNSSPSPFPESPGYSVTSPGSPALPTVESPTRSPATPPLADWRDHVDEIPRLPSPRPRDLTPYGFRDSDTRDQQRHVHALPQNSFWFKVPPNLRRDILRLAFGDRRLHMGLKIDNALSPTWHSFGMVCHRVSPEDEGPMTRGSLKEGPWVDNCGASRQEPEPIGIIGWLLSCRHNYAEAIDILYSMNTILIYDEPLLTRLTQLVLPHRLAHVTSLEIRLPFKTVDHLNTAFHHLSPSHFPNLKRLYMSLEYDVYIEPSIAPSAITAILNEFVRNRSDLVEYGSLHAVRLPYVDSYPKPPFQLGPNPGRGYWLLEGTCAPLTWRWRSSSHGFSGLFTGWYDPDEDAEN
ncbi:hypothetical protein FGSG_03276 [Fusarium graminearum PH-1]|uniref:Chromosome 2, complete genome n=1 Tax=Gibberella zeae (strain ATCC MYA-4620 / CBS 123657 / FGSC 9075 / NRRL 31084 / PH-1) TaxID=229533 RepID=I1RHL7_GIBZE|nr:hypothetical protein FGSG_03276 [Fusarium graminearum PH-1]ESU09973.1 hypothetical protein FGSG_03276 [Fusarium graminearum PH-1]EYB32531.1 hypothetical protein FG05_03276 [Fusarium graminearum]CEF78044.1 unnamed protein product [Fusarium graminearum]|eukprot:XP_011322472.1 hypothetical protein FGSG_03276 [Fusarium graminearum PH-1]